MSELQAVTEYSVILLNISPCSKFHLYLRQFRTSYLLSSHLYQKDERALPGDLSMCEFSYVSPLLDAVSRTTHPLYLLSLSPDLKG
jgi:hypothetical protein